MSWVVYCDIFDKLLLLVTVHVITTVQSGASRAWQKHSTASSLLILNLISPLPNLLISSSLYDYQNIAFNHHPLHRLMPIEWQMHLQDKCNASAHKIKLDSSASFNFDTYIHCRVYSCFVVSWLGYFVFHQRDVIKCDRNWCEFVPVSGDSHIHFMLQPHREALDHKWYPTNLMLPSELTLKKTMTFYWPKY